MFSLIWARNITIFLIILIFVVANFFSGRHFRLFLPLWSTLSCYFKQSILLSGNAEKSVSHTGFCVTSLLVILTYLLPIICYCFCQRLVQPVRTGAVTKIHTPAACYRSRLVIRCHCAVSQRVHLFSTHGYRAKHQQQCQQSKQFCFQFHTVFKLFVHFSGYKST